MTMTYWNGLPAPARRGTAIVARAESPNHWTLREGLIGHRIAVVEVNLQGVNYGGGIEYIDNLEEWGWTKVTALKGSPRSGHRSVVIEPNSFIEDGA